MDETLAIILRWRDASGRRSAAEALARHLGAEAIFVFVRDEEVGSVVPAPGLPQTHPGGPKWRALLSRGMSPGRYEVEVAYPHRSTIAPAIALVLPDGTIWVFIGAAAALAAEHCEALALVSALLRAEHASFVASGRATAAREAACHADAVTKALDATRSELQRAAERERAARAEAEAASRAKDEFLAILGHELRNPLAPIVTALQLLKLRGHAGTAEFEIIERQLHHVIRLVDDLLDIARITRGTVELRRRPVELASVATKAIEMATPLLERRRHRFTVSIPRRGMMLDADELRLAQVIANLLTNAARYTHPGGEVSLRAIHVGGNVEITVADTGVGIEPEILPRIFDLFAQGKRASDRAEGGLGLGLALVRNLVSMHGGSVEARSEGRDRGSEFVVRLPVYVADLTGVGGSRPVAPDRLRTDGLRRRVLIVDDNADAAELLGEAIRMHGHEVTIVHDGPAALKAFERFGPDVVVLDIGLPVMDGFEVARRIRALPDGKATRLIAVTGYGQPDDRSRTEEAGFDAHLVKPVDLDEVMRELV